MDIPQFVPSNPWFLAALTFILFSGCTTLSIYIFLKHKPEKKEFFNYTIKQLTSICQIIAVIITLIYGTFALNLHEYNSIKSQVDQLKFDRDLIYGELHTAETLHRGEIYNHKKLLSYYESQIKNYTKLITAYDKEIDSRSKENLRLNELIKNSKYELDQANKSILKSEIGLTYLLIHIETITALSTNIELKFMKEAYKKDFKVDQDILNENDLKNIIKKIAQSNLNVPTAGIPHKDKILKAFLKDLDKNFDPINISVAMKIEHQRIIGTWNGHSQEYIHTETNTPIDPILTSRAMGKFALNEFLSILTQFMDASEKRIATAIYN